MRVCAVFATLCLAPVLAQAAPGGPAAFERLKQLDGNWKSQGPEGVVYVTWRLVGGGTSVLETVSNADRTKVTSATVYVLEGGELVANHFGSEPQRPRLTLKASDAGRLRFEAEAPKDAKASYVSSVVVSMKEELVSVEWTTTQGGKPSRRTVELKREYLETLK